MKKIIFPFYSRILAGSAFLFVAGFLLLFLMPTPAFAIDYELMSSNGYGVTTSDPYWFASPKTTIDIASATYHMGSYPDTSGISGSMGTGSKSFYTLICGQICSSWSNGTNAWVDIIETGTGDHYIFEVQKESSYQWHQVAVSLTPSETCTDGILNQDETGIDVGGICESLSISSPVDSSTSADFLNWSLSYSGIDTDSEDFHFVVHYSTDSSILSTCSDFPSGHGYEDCINGNPSIKVDSGPLFSSGVGALSSSVNVGKSSPLTMGKTYYVQAFVKIATSEIPVLSSSVISFTAGVPSDSDTAIATQECSAFDFMCYIKQGFNWLFAISPATLNQFSTLSLEDRSPFSYLYDVGTLFNELFSNTGSMTYAVSASTPIGTINFISASAISSVPFASTIKTILGYMLYFFTAMTIYRLVLKVYAK